MKHISRTLVIGGARSGKSTYAEMLASTSEHANNKKIIYIATAQRSDVEMAQRITHHQHTRDKAWRTVEEPIALAAAIEKFSTSESVLLIDCLTVWLSNLLFSEPQDFPEVGTITAPACFHTERDAFLQALAQAQGDVILVSNEVGQGIVPEGAVSRWFVDEAGRLNQAVAAACEHAVMIVAGLPLKLKG